MEVCNVEYYSKIPKIIEEVQWKEDKFNVEIITNSKIDNLILIKNQKVLVFK